MIKRLALLPLALATAASLSTANIANAALDDYLTITTRSPALTNWGPTGERLASDVELNNPVMPDSGHFYALHGGVRSADEVPLVLAPVFTQTWNAESNAFVTEGPAFGADGSAYITPQVPTTNADGSRNLLIKVSTQGQRRLSITDRQLGSTQFGPVTMPATFGVGGATVVLRDPVGNRDVAYGSTFTRAWAVDENGNLLWSTAIMPASIASALNSNDPAQLEAELRKPHRTFGFTYHPAVDALITADISGDLMMFDRATGQQIGAVQMPGSPATGGDNLGLSSALTPEQIAKLTTVLTDLGIQTLRHDGIEFDESVGLTPILALIGGGAVIGNQISVDPNTNALWVASTDLDEVDSNPGDGLSEKGALYRIDLTRNGNNLSANVTCSASFDGGTASTPAVSADGQRIYTTDNFGSALAFDRQCQEVWRLDVGEAAIGSLAVSSEVGAEIYYPTLTTVYKIQENSRRDGAEVVWHADMNSSFRGGRFRDAANAILSGVRGGLERRLGEQLPNGLLSFQAFNLDVATIGQNGIMAHAGYGMMIDLDGLKFGLPLAMNVSMYDRETGALINATPALEENIGTMYTAPDGTITMGSSPLRRAVFRALVKAPDFALPDLSRTLDAITDRMVDFVVRPLTGGITQYGVTARFDLLARDAICQAEKRLRNAERYKHLTSASGRQAEVADTLRLLQQAQNAMADARARFEISLRNMRRVNNALSHTKSNLDRGRLFNAANDLADACQLLR